MASIPFSISVYEGFAEAQGLIRFDEGENTLILEFQVKDGFVGFLKSGLKEVRIPISEIESVRLKDRLWMKPVLIIRASQLSTLSDIPESSQGEVKLHVSRKNKRDARLLASNVMLTLSDYELKKLGG